MTRRAVPSDVFSIGVGPYTGSGPVQEVGTFSTVTVTQSLDTGTTVAFELPGTSPAARQIDELATDVWVYLAAATIARCRVVSVEQTFGPEGGDSVQVSAVDYKGLMNNRHVHSGLEFVSVDQAVILWNLIVHTQAQTGGDLGITSGTLDGGGITRDRSYSPGDNLGNIMGNLSNVINGPWWGIDADLVLNVAPFDSFTTALTPILLGVTARVMNRQSGVGQFANAAIITGNKDATVPLAIANSDLGTDPRGRWERVESFPSVTEQNTLDEKGEGLLQSARSPIARWAAEIDPARYLVDAAYTPGQFVDIVVPPSLVAPIGVPEFSVFGQITSVTLTIDADGTTGVSVIAVEVPDEL